MNSHFAEVEPYNYSKEFLRTAYEELLLPRMIEEKMLLLLRQGKISKWFSGIGEEATSVGVALGLRAEEYIFTLHRNLGVFTTRGVELGRLFEQLQGTAGGFTAGRDRSFHFGTREHRIIGMISHLGPQLAFAAGIGLAQQNRQERSVTAVFTGEGGTSEGDFHEALNVASVWKLPVLFIVVNNGYALSTPVSEQYACNSLVDRGIGYGMDAASVDGNDLLAVYEAVQQVTASIRENPRPVLLECRTFRMRGHEEASGVRYVPRELLDEWGEKDPIRMFADKLLARQILSELEMDEIRDSHAGRIDTAIEKAFSRPPVEANQAREQQAIYAPVPVTATDPVPEAQNEVRFIDAISDALALAMEQYPELVLMGQDIAEYGGVFKITDGFIERFGAARVRNTPLCESAIIGLGAGLAVCDVPSMIEMQFSDFVSCGFNQIVNNLAKLHYRWGQPCNVVLRLPSGGGVGAGPFHSQTTEAWFFHCPGLKIAYPAFPEDAKGLLLRAFEDPNPVLFFEHKKLYRSVVGPVPESYYSIEFGKARIVQEGNAATIVTYGLGVHWALAHAERHPDQSLEIIDLRTLAPLDYGTVYDSVEKTGRALVVYEANYTGAVGAEVAARIAADCFDYLDAPVRRCGSLDTPIPFASTLEEQYLAASRLEVAVEELLGY